MSKTASEWIAEGLAHSKNGKNQEAIKCFDEAIAADPNCGEAYFQKGFINDKPELLEAEVELYKKAISVGYVTAQCYYCLGVGYKDLGRFEEGLAANITAIEKKPDYWQAYENKGQALMAMGRSEESIEAYRNVVRLYQGKAVVYCHLGSLLETVGKTDEAMENYITAAQKGASFGYLLKGELELTRGKYEEAIADLLKSKQMNMSIAIVNASLANAYKAIGKNDQAMKMYEEVTKFNPRNCHEYCNRGQSFFALGNKPAAMNDFRKADELLRTDKKTVFSPHYVKFIKDTLKAIFDAEDVAAKAEAEVAKLTVGNAATNRFVEALKKLQDEKDKVNGKLISQIGKSNANANQEAADNVSELNKLKEEFQRQLNEIRAEVGQVKVEVKTIDNKVQKLEKNMEEMKEELSNKLDDFEKKLTSELNKQDLSADDQQKLKGYYSAFVQTFSCVYVTSQVVDSGQVSLDTGSSATTILSTIASFAPFVGNTLSSGITSIGEFLKSQELIKNARRMKGLAHDPSKLSQIVGQSAFEILQDKTQQQKVINTTDEDLQKASGNLYQKILLFCEKLSEKIDTFLYTELYSTPAERLGHNDANELISLFLKGTITPFGAQKQFVKETLNPSSEAAAGEGSALEKEKDKTQGRSACCNMF